MINLQTELFLRGKEIFSRHRQSQAKLRTFLGNVRHDSPLGYACRRAAVELERPIRPGTKDTCLKVLAILIIYADPDTLSVGPLSGVFPKVIERTGITYGRTVKALGYLRFIRLIDYEGQITTTGTAQISLVGVSSPRLRFARRM